MGDEKEIRYFSMFTGVGGFELGFERANENNRQEEVTKHIPSESDMQNLEIGTRKWKHYVCVGVSEIDKYASELLSKKFPSVKNWGDCRTINPSELPDFDLLCGGFPCQAFSIAGKRRGFNDTRGTMFFEIARILKVKRPKIVLLENVKGLLNHNKGETFRVILQTLDELGYNVQWMVLNSKFFGVPQNRERVFIIGSLRGERRPEILPFRESSKEINEQHARLPQQNVPTVFASQHKIARGMPMIKVPQSQIVKGTDGVSSTINAHGGGQGAKTGLYEIENMKIRRLTPTECERLQGFPDGWTEGVSDTQRYKQMGNAVTVNVIKIIGEKLK